MTQHPPQASDCRTGPCEQSRARAPWPQYPEGPLDSVGLNWPVNVSEDIVGGTWCRPRHSSSLRVCYPKAGRGGEPAGRRPSLPSRGREHSGCVQVLSSSVAKTCWRQRPRDKSLPPSLGSGCHVQHLSGGIRRRPVPEQSQISMHHTHRPAKQGTQGLYSDDGIEPLTWAMTELDLQSQKQLQQDEELAQRLQEEEQAHIRAQQNEESHDDYRAAQVAQDEEIARYMQDQELKAQWSTLGKDPKTESIEEAHSLPGQRQSRSLESYQKGALKSCEAASLLRVQTLDRSEAPTRGGPTSAMPQLCRNIAEDLDPTFQAKRTELSTTDQTVFCSPGPARPVPVEGFFDYLDDASTSTFVSPTKRQSEKVGRQKSKDKKEGCKQQ